MVGGRHAFGLPVRCQFILAQLASHVAAWRTAGTLAPWDGTKFTFVGKFCFDYKKEATKDSPAGKLEVLIEGIIGDSPAWQPVDKQKKEDLPQLPNFPHAPGGLYLAVFSDAEDQWQSVRDNWTELTADDFLNRAAAVRAVSPVLPVGRFNASVRIEEAERPRFLYFVFVFYATKIYGDSIPVSYKIHATNPMAGLEKEFSFDEQGAISLQTWGILLFAGMVTAVVIGTRASFGAGALATRPLLQLLLLSCICSAVGCLFTLVHQLHYASEGVGLGYSQVLGELLASLARLQLSCLQLYIANGKALLNAPEEFARRILIQVLVLGIIVVSLGCEIYARYFGDLDWSTTLYFYASWPGLLILTFNSLLFAEVLRSTHLLYKQPNISRAVQRFYVFTFAAAVLYFTALPLTCALAHVLHPWDRKKVVDRVELIVRFLASAILVFCLRPTRLDTMINARMEVPEKRQQAIELAGGLSGLS